MVSKYGIFCKVLETKSFTKAAEILGIRKVPLVRRLNRLSKKWALH